jgi:hypothetical protein
MAEVTRLAQCYRCRRVFVARPGERYCPNCRRELARERNRRRLGIGATVSGGSWGPILWVVALTVVGTLVGHPYIGALAGIAVTVVRQLRPHT